MAESRFGKLSASVQRRQHIGKRRADAIAASIGRKKYGAKRFAAMSRAGRKK